jgi:hypothetical protein
MDKPPRSLWKRTLAWFVTVLVALDILGAAIIGGRPGETISHMANRLGWETLCSVLDLVDPDHCLKVEF